MSRRAYSVGQIRTKQRDLWIITSLVILALGAGLALLWPEMQDAAMQHFGPDFPSTVLLCLHLFLILFLVIYLWVKGHHIGGLARQLGQERGMNQGLQVRLATLRSILQTSSQLHVDNASGEGLVFILEETTRALRGDRGVLYRVRPGSKEPERDAAFPSAARAPAAGMLAFEDEMARAVVAGGTSLFIDEDTNPQELGIRTARPRRSVRCLVAAPLIVDGECAGAILIINPCGLTTQRLDEDGLELLEIFAGFAANLIQNLRLFRQVADRNAELDRTHDVLTENQQELVEVETVSILGRIGCSMAHALSGPMMSLHGYADILTREQPDTPAARTARHGLHAEFIKLRDRLQSLIDFTAAYRVRYEFVDVNRVLREAFDLREGNRQALGIECTLDLADPLPPTVADPIRLHQAFQAFLEFSEECMQDSKDTRRLLVQTQPTSGRIRATFAFYGKPNALEIAEPLLNPNVEIGPLHRQHGLSLAIANNSIRTHQGDVSVDITDDHRFELNVEIPIRRDIPPTPQRTFALTPDLDPQEATVEDVLDHILRVAEPGTAGTSAPMAAGPVEPMAPTAAPTPSRLAGTTPATTSHPAAPRTTAPPTPVAPVVPMPPQAPASAPQTAAPTSPVAPGSPVAPASPAAQPMTAAPTAAAPVGANGGPEKAGLNELFSPGDLWATGDSNPVRAPRPKAEKDKKTGAPLLDPGEVEDALKLFDDGGNG